ncbi:MAG: metallophosphoesterase [Anaerolineae bacterium]
MTLCFDWKNRGTVLRFIHITDTHIGPTPDYALRGVNPYRALADLVDQLNALTFDVDFILHSGDIVDDFTEESYRTARTLLEKLKRPVYYLPGNHDDAKAMQRALLDIKRPKARYDQVIRSGGVEIITLDSRGPLDPGGLLLPQQLQWLHEQCKPKGDPLVIALHHQPVHLDSYWLDQGGASWEAGRFMVLKNHTEFLEAIKPARKRLRGVLFGHIHRAFQVVEQGILFASAPSVAMQFYSWPDQQDPIISEEPGGFNVVTVNEDGIIVRQHYLKRQAISS